MIFKNFVRCCVYVSWYGREKVLRPLDLPFHSIVSNGLWEFDYLFRLECLQSEKSMCSLSLMDHCIHFRFYVCDDKTWRNLKKKTNCDCGAFKVAEMFRLDGSKNFEIDMLILVWRGLTVPPHSVPPLYYPWRKSSWVIWEIAFQNTWCSCIWNLKGPG